MRKTPAGQGKGEDEVADSNQLLEEGLRRLLEEFGASYEIRRNIRLGELEAPAMAELHMTEERGVLGFAVKGLAGVSSEANEYLLFLLEESFTEKSARRAMAFSEAAEKELLNLHSQHGYTLFSVVVLTLAPQREALALLRRYKRRSTYLHGWGMARLAVLDVAARKAHWSRDGKDLGRLALQRL